MWNKWMRDEFMGLLLSLSYKEDYAFCDNVETVFRFICELLHLMSEGKRPIV